MTSTISKQLLLLCASALFAVNSNAQVKVYVYPASTDGFVESTRIPDTLKDLREVISKRKDMQLVDDKDSASITLELVNSGLVAAGSEANTRVRPGIFGGATSTTTTTDKALPNVTVVLRVKGSDYEKQIGMTRQLLWKDLAKRVVDQVSSWITANRAQLPQ
jgi:hypothetical protein